MVAVLLGTTYAATIGGFTTLVGTPTNLVFVEVWERSYPDADPVSAGQWMVAVVPLGAAFLAITWAVLVRNLPELPQLGGPSGGGPSGGGSSGGGQRSYFRDELRRLGPMSRPEWLMLAVFAATALLWLLRKDLEFADTTLVPGWGAWVQQRLGTAEIHDSTVAMAMVLLMFVLPAKRDEFGRTVPLMDWQTAEKLPWGILLLFGGGFALAGAFSSTGLAKWLGEVFASGIAGWPAWLIVAGVCFLVTFLSELTSNVATCATLLPVLVGVTAALPIDPRLILVAATIAASCGFMLPIATPPNAIVFGTGRIRMAEMARAGLILNLIAVALVTAAMFLYTGPALGVKDAPARSQESGARSQAE
jgi:sodium-dependent dicarboxylate transporter 2/3/5